MRDGWKPDSTWIEFDCGPYLAKHQHLDQNQITIYHQGYLAIDSGADYTDSESPHYLNYYRRTVAHNSVLVYDPSEKFFWSQNLLPAANDGGQRMDSSRFWNTIRSPEDWQHTRDLWNLGSMRVVDHVPGQYHYAMGDASNAYSREKLKKFTREVLYAPAEKLLFVFDRVVSTDPSFPKSVAAAWSQPAERRPGRRAGNRRGERIQERESFRFREGSGELLVHSLLPRERVVTRRGGPGHDFYTPGDDHGGAWGSGENWPLEPRRAVRCRKTRNSSTCGRRFGVTTSPKSLLRTARTWCPARGASKCRRRFLPRKISFFTFSRWEMWGQQERSESCGSKAATLRERQLSRGHASFLPSPNRRPRAEKSRYLRSTAHRSWLAVCNPMMSTVCSSTDPTLHHLRHPPCRALRWTSYALKRTALGCLD